MGSPGDWGHLNQEAMGFLKNLLTGQAGDLVGAVGQVLDQVTSTREEKMQLENELRKAEMEFQTEMRKLSVEEQQIRMQEMDSARRRDLETQASANATRLGKNIAPYLALGTTLLTFGLFYMLIFQKESVEGNRDVILYVLGVLSAIVTQIFSYYFGSSLGSADKNQIISDLGNRTKQAV